MAEDPTLWGGRFEGAPDEDMLHLTRSIDVDMELLWCDVVATKAHARVLVAAGLLGGGDLAPLDEAIDAIEREVTSGDLQPAATDEDVHSFVERELTRRLGELGSRIHAGRSRNDLVATDMRLWCRSAARDLAARARRLATTLCDRAEELAEVVMPGLTHLQPGQPVTLGFHLVAHAVALERDSRRLDAAEAAADVSCLGAGALAGSTLALEPEIAGRELAFADTFINAMDAVSDRDFACDLLYACAVTGVHLSRIGEELVLWSSPLTGWAALPEAWTTGSSMMPNKRNPDIAELVRGRAAGAIADLNGLLVLLKGLPLAYDRDLQEDKGFVFDSVRKLSGCLEGMTAVIGGLTFDVERLAAAAAGGFSWGTDAAEAMVARGMAFREAHRAAGLMVAAAERSGSPGPVELTAPLTPEDAAGFEPRASVERRDTPGATSPRRVREQVASLRAALAP